MSSFGTELEVQKRVMRHTDMRAKLIDGGVADGKVGRVSQQVSGLVFANSTRVS
jgi:hypothetical protein